MKEKIITIEVNNLNDVFNIYNPEIINDELHNYIMHQCLGVSVYKPLKFMIEGNFNDDEKEKIESAIKNYYKSYINHYKSIDKYDDWVRLILLLIGIVLIFASQKFDFVISELLLVIGWVAIWELGYDILFYKQKRKRDYFRYKQIYSSKIEFKS